MKQHFHVVMLLCVLGFNCQSDSYTTRTSMPTPRSNPACGCVGGDVFVIGGYPGLKVNEKYSILADVWITVTQLPFTGLSMGYAASGSAVFIARLNYFVVYTAPTDTWASLTPMPNSRERLGGLAHQNHFYAIGGESTTLERYSIAADTWTTLTSMPTSRPVECPPLVGHGVPAEEAIVVVGGGSSKLEKYFIASDAWTSATRFPAARYYVAGFSLAEHNTAYFLAGSTSVPAAVGYSILMKYSVHTDTWTTVTERPKAFTGPAVAVSVIAGYYHAFLMGGYTGTSSVRRVHTYIAATASAGVEGDPIFTTFMGQRVHLDLHTGVYQLLSTTAAVVNMLVDRVVTLPPEEDLVILMVGIASNKPSPYVVDCGCGQDDDMVCSMRGVENSATSPPTSFSVDADGFSIRVEQQNMAVIVERSDHASVAVSRWLNVYITTHVHTATQFASGLLPHLDSRGFSALSSAIDGYEVSSGCLFASHVPASALFTPLPAIASLCQGE